MAAYLRCTLWEIWTSKTTENDNAVFGLSQKTKKENTFFGLGEKQKKDILDFRNNLNNLNDSAVFGLSKKKAIYLF